MAIDGNGNQLPHRDLTKYDNGLNNVAMDNFTAKELDIFWAIATQIRDSNADTVVFTYKELMDMIQLKDRRIKTLTGQLDKMSDDLITLRVVDRTGNAFDKLNAFSRFKADPDEKTLTIVINDMFRPYLNDLTANFTLFSLQKYVTLKSKYAKKLFVHLKQYRTTGLYVANKDQLYELLGLSTTYRRNSSLVDQRVLEPAIEELNDPTGEDDGKFKNLKYTKYDRDGKQITNKGQHVWQYRFTFEPQKATTDDEFNKQQQAEQIEKQIKFAQEKIDLTADPAEKRKWLQMMSGLSMQLAGLLDEANGLDLSDVKITDSEGNEITGDDKPVNYSDESFTWEHSDSMPSEKYQLNITAEKVSPEELSAQKIKEAELNKADLSEEDKPSIANQNLKSDQTEKRNRIAQIRSLLGKTEDKKHE